MINAIKKILLVDDEERLLNSMAQRLTLLGFEALIAFSGTEAVDIARKARPDMAIVDLKLPDMDGLETIKELKQILPDLKTVLLTGYGSQQIRLQARKTGTRFFDKDSMGGLWDLIKHFNEQEKDVVMHPTASTAASKNLSSLHPKRDVQHPSVLARNSGLPKDPADFFENTIEGVPKIIGEMPQMQRLRKDIQRMSELDCTVLIRGETGSGKETAARAIHGLSHRRNQRFLAFNCGCFSSDFHFDELLGSLETAEHPSVSGFTGTILLDHFSAMPLETQQEMIKLFDRMDAARAGDTAFASRDIRFMIATHQDLKTRVLDGTLEESLYHKLNVIELTIPALRDRRDDILPLCSYFLNKLNKEFEKNITTVSDEVLSIFNAYQFPGNVRELKHILERAVILSSESTIQPGHLPERFIEKKSPQLPDPGKNHRKLSLAYIEQQHILSVLELTHGNKSKAAEYLGISRAALWRKLKLMDTEK